MEVRFDFLQRISRRFEQDVTQMDLRISAETPAMVWIVNVRWETSHEVDCECLVRNQPWGIPRG